MNKSIAIFIAALIVLTAVLPLGCASHKDEAPGVSHAAENTEAASAEPTSAEPAKQTCIVHAFKFASSGITDPDPHFDYEAKETRFVDESKAGTEKTVEFHGRQFELTYEQTIVSVIDDLTCDKYSVNGAEKEYVILLPDDSIYVLGMSIKRPIFELDVTGSDDPDAVRAIVEEALKDEIDFSRYDSQNLIRTCHNEDGTGSGSFDFGWFRQKGEYSTMDRVEVHVDMDGGVTGVRMFYRAFPGLDAPDDVNIRDYSDAIEQYLRGLYGENYLSYTVQHVRWTTVEGKTGLYAQISVSRKDNSDYVELFIEILP